MTATKSRAKPEHLLKRARRLYPSSLLLKLRPEERFDLYVVPEPNSGCHIWIGNTIYSGYGRFMYGPFGKQIQMLAHRYAYERHIGPIPEGMTLDHKCRVRCCVNPNHLEPVTQLENVRRAYARRASYGRLFMVQEA